jgi:gamma-glutamyl phosphate reductase
MNKGLFVLVIIFLSSCKTKAVFVDTKSPTNTDSIVTSEKIIRNHYNNKIDFSTLYIRASVKYKYEDDSQSVSAEVKIKKDAQILVIIRVLGITLDKALITPL